MLESKLQRSCADIVRKHNGFVFKVHGDMFMRVGLPDLIACVPVSFERLRELVEEGIYSADNIGIFVGIELKQPGKMDNVTKAQKIVAKEISNAGGLALLTDNSDDVHQLMRLYTGDRI